MVGKKVIAIADTSGCGCTGGQFDIKTGCTGTVIHVGGWGMWGIDFDNWCSISTEPNNRLTCCIPEHFAIA